MKTIKHTLALALLISLAHNSYTQTFNWRNLNTNQPHTININAGWDYGLVFGLGYSYQLHTKMPIVLHANYSFPSGNHLFDDFKVEMGGSVQLVRLNDFRASAKIEGVFRRYQNESVRLLNFGSDLSGVIGYYRQKWFVAGEAGFDKAIVTHFKHSDAYKENYRGVQDGWYIPTGGNFLYGVQGGYALKHNDIYLKIGRAVTQDFKTTPFIPYYFQLGFNSRF